MEEYIATALSGEYWVGQSVEECKAMQRALELLFESQNSEGALEDRGGHHALRQFNSTGRK